MKNNNIFQGIVFIGLIIVIIVFASNSNQTTIVGGDSERNILSVSGRSELTVEPDKADIFVNIETLSKTAKNSKDENARISDDVRKALTKAGVKKNNIETTQFSINPSYRYDRSKGKSELIGYTVTNILKVTTEDIDTVGEYLDAAVDSGATRINSINFGLTKEKQKDVNGEAMIRASQVAREKAEALATNLGLRLGKVASVSESSFDYVPFVSRTFAVAEAAVAAPVPTEISPQDITIRATVNVVFEIK